MQMIVILGTRVQASMSIRVVTRWFLCRHLAQKLPGFRICRYVDADVVSLLHKNPRRMRTKGMVELTLVYPNDPIIVRSRQCRSRRVPLPLYR